MNSVPSPRPVRTRRRSVHTGRIVSFDRSSGTGHILGDCGRLFRLFRHELVPPLHAADPPEGRRVEFDYGPDPKSPDR